MSAARRRRVGVGDRILAGGVPNVVVGVSGTRVRLADDEGRVQTVTAADLADGARFGIPSPAPPRGPRAGTGLEGLPAADSSVAFAFSRPVRLVRSGSYCGLGLVPAGASGRSP